MKNENKKENGFSDMGFAMLDPYRARRTGIPEAVFCKGKKSREVAIIMKDLHEKSKDAVIATKATIKDYEETKKLLPGSIYYEDAQIILDEKKYLENDEKTYGNEKEANIKYTNNVEKVAIITGGTSDIPIAEEARITLKAMNVEVEEFYDVGVASIERLFSKLEKIREAKVIIVIAGMEGALASVIGGLVKAPIIAVPTSVGYGANFEGIAALLSMLNSCAPGVSIVNIDNGFGAACSAIKILNS